MSSQNDSGQHYPTENNRKMYQGMMDFGFAVGLPVGGAIAVLVAFLLMQAGIIPSLIAAFVAWLLLFIISKSFFVH